MYKVEPKESLDIWFNSNVQMWVVEPFSCGENTADSFCGYYPRFYSGNH